PSSEQKRLKETQVLLASLRKQDVEKDRQIQQDTDKLVRAISLRNQQVELHTELEEAAALHPQELVRQEQRLQDTHRDELASHLRRAEQAERAALQAPPTDSALAPLADSELQEHEAAAKKQLAEVGAAHTELFDSQVQRCTRLREELLEAQADVGLARQERDSEVESAKVTEEACLAEHRASERKSEALSVEVRTKRFEMEAFQDSQRGLDGQARMLQKELSKVAYTFGQRDHELKVKDSELQEVRQSLASIQDEMDDVHLRLKEQCGRVQRVEGELSASRDLGEKVRGMRQMLQESHGAIGQLRDALEQERQKKEQCSQGLKQQRLRTELLLQLLHHFKNRTQDLAPQAMLAGCAGGAEIIQGAGNFPKLEPMQDS
ncbi:unnamed protein product, partial [Polarella glacialis]